MFSSAECMGFPHSLPPEHPLKEETEHMMCRCAQLVETPILMFSPSHESLSSPVINWLKYLCVWGGEGQEMLQSNMNYGFWEGKPQKSESLQLCIQVQFVLETCFHLETSHWIQGVRRGIRKHFLRVDRFEN